MKPRVYLRAKGCCIPRKCWGASPAGGTDPMRLQTKILEGLFACNAKSSFLAVRRAAHTFKFVPLKSGGAIVLRLLLSLGLRPLRTSGAACFGASRRACHKHS